jgi:preprotein translocase subunit SecA
MAAESNSCLLFDDLYYRVSYPEATLAIDKGVYSSAKEHWELEGASKCFAPNEFLPKPAVGNCNSAYYHNCDTISKIADYIEQGVKSKVNFKPISTSTINYLKSHAVDKNYIEEIIYITINEVMNRLNMKPNINVQTELFFPLLEQQCYLTTKDKALADSCLKVIKNLSEWAELTELAYLGKVNKLTLDAIVNKIVEEQQLCKPSNTCTTPSDKKLSLLETIDLANGGQYIPGKDIISYLADSFSNKLLAKPALSIAHKLIKFDKISLESDVLSSIWKIINSYDSSNDLKKVAIECIGQSLKNSKSILKEDELKQIASFLKYHSKLGIAAKYAILAHKENNGKISDEIEKLLSDRELLHHTEFSKIPDKTNTKIWQEVDENIQSLYAKDPNQITKLNNAAAKVKDTITKAEQLYQEQNIYSWKQEDIDKWRANFTTSEINNKLPEVIAVIKRAMKLSKNIEPRTVQLIATLMLWYGDNGRLAEISTGEGKTTIASMLAVLHILSGKKYVDIVTSSSVLAKDGKEEQESFYNMFGIEVDYNTERHEADLKRTYKNSVVYGTAAKFIGDIIPQEAGEYNYRGTRTTEVLIVDEVDNLFIDQSSHIVMLSEMLPRFEFLEPLLIAIWKELGILVALEGITKIPPEKIAIFIDRLVQFSKNYINRSDNAYPVPINLKEFVEHQIKNWAKSAIHAHSYYKKGTHYIIDKELDGREKIILMDHSNTGTVMHSMVMSNGLHQFLQIKHLLTMTPEQVTVNFMSNIEFFKKYGHNIFGMTGTLGSEAEQEFIHKSYGVDFIKIPTFKPKNFEIMPGLIASGNDFIKVVLYNMLAEIDQGRAVLLIAPSKDEADNYKKLLEELFSGDLKDAGYNIDQVRLYTRNDNHEAEVMDQVLKPGDIVISTNLAGRGADFKTTSSLEQNGGLHVILTSLPHNLRIEWQAYGRTSRQGKSGSAQMIVDVADAIYALASSYPTYNKEIYSIDDLKEWRDLANSYNMKNLEACYIPMMRLKDKLYKEYRIFISKYEKLIPGDQILKKNASIRQIEELWGIWLSNQQNLFDCNNTKTLDDLKQIEINAYAELSKFKANIDQKYKQKQLITNPSYVVADGFSTIEELTSVIALDPKYSFMAYYQKALKLALNNDGNGAEASLIGARDSLQEIAKIYSMPRFFLQPYEMESALANQVLSKLDIVEELIYNIENNIALAKAIKEKQNGEDGDRIRFKIESCTKINKAMTNYNLIKPEVEEFIALFGKDEFCELGYYVVPPEKDYFGNVFAAIFSIAQIALGFALPGSNFLVSALGHSFIQHFSVGLVIGGIKGVVSTAITTAQGIPIDIESYLKGKGLELAATAILAGIQTGLEGTKLGDLLKIENVKDAANPNLVGAIQDSFLRELGTQAGIEVAKEIIAAGITDAVKSNKGNIEESIRNALNRLFIEHKDAIAKILAIDVWDNRSHNNQQRALLTEADSLLASYYSSNGGDHQTILRQVIGGTILAPVATAVDVGVTYQKTTELTARFCNDYGRSIESGTPSDVKLMNAALRGINLGNTEIDGIMAAMQTAGITKDGQISSCDQINSLNIKNQEKAKEACNKAKTGLSGSAEQAKRDELTKELTKKVTDKMLKLIHNGIVVPISHNLASFTWKQIGEAQGLIPKAPKPEVGNTIVRAMYTLDEAVLGGAFTTAQYMVDGGINILKEKFNPPNDKPPANDNKQGTKEDLKPAIALKGSLEDLTPEETWALIYGYGYKLENGKLVFIDGKGNLVDIKKGYDQAYRHGEEAANLKLLQNYYKEQQKSIPYGASKAVFDGDRPFVGKDGKLYFLKNDGSTAAADHYSKTFDPTKPPPLRPIKTEIIEINKQISVTKEATYKLVTEGIISKTEVTEIYTELAKVGALAKTVKSGAEKLVEIKNWYEEFASNHPLTAEYGLSIATILFKGAIGGVAGLIGGTLSEGAGMAIGAASSPVIGKAIISTAKTYKEKNPLLTDDEAVVVAGASLMAGSLVFSAKSIMQGMRELSGLKLSDFFPHGDDLAYAGAHTRHDWFEVEIDADGNSHTFFRKADIPDTVQKVGPSYPRNADKAGKVYHAEDLPASIKAKYSNIANKYPNGIRFDDQGFPDFSPYTTHTVKLEKFVNYDNDFRDANKLAGFKIEPKGYTWHHHQDGKTMQLIPKDLHNAFAHTGGMATTKHGVNNQ